MKIFYLRIISQNYLQYGIDITTEQRFNMELTDVKIWISKDASLCQVFSDQVTYSYEWKILQYRYMRFSLYSKPAVFSQITYIPATFSWFLHVVIVLYVMATSDLYLSKQR